MEKHMLPCMNKQLFGVECPGCGTQRAIAFLLEGEFYEAFKIFPAIYTLGLFFILLGLHLLDKKRNYAKLVIASAILNGAVILIAYLIKIYFNTVTN
ncbi:DUF2752 domain-containing protein [Flavobacterium cheniae]|uniref:Uncharacterized protein DUF2752 n=1 Tax=Flavobacterium cheniae TaxID=295428 RepID=A0A562KCH3_9FLAO|nr:DUF2752 domain-containing protein [Flavobacterium cheniae]TDR25312.1 uncharacterized protein DUF2752 [Flavobacterium cheniae]TWH93101.1 uncharacterized protein DUF2752 [Flavobacterium cheniae]